MKNKDHFLLEGFLDWIVATAKGFQKIDCIIREDVSLELNGKTAKRYRVLDEQNGKCYWCQKPLDYSQSGLVQIDGKPCCLCPKCRDRYSELINKEIPSKSYYVLKSGDKTKINFTLIKYEIEEELKERGIVPKKFLC